MANQDIGSRKEVGGQRGHTKAQAPVISLSEPGRLRVAHLMALFAISHSTLYQGIREGRYPQPDGRDGRFPFWKTEPSVKSLCTRSPTPPRIHAGMGWGHYTLNEVPQLSWGYGLFRPVLKIKNGGHLCLA